MKKFTLTLLVLIAVAGCFALEPKDNRGFGLHFGTVMGNGWSYRYFAGTTGVQVTAGVYTAKSNRYNFDEEIYPYYYDYSGNTITIDDEGMKTVGDLGINLLFTLKEAKKGKFYLTLGSNYVLSRQKMYYQDYMNTDEDTDFEQYGAAYEDTINRDKWYIGAGPGVELQLGDNFMLAIEVPITYSNKDELTMTMPQAGIYYYFK